MKELKDCQVGDKVFSIINGYGTIFSIDLEFDSPILINFEGDIHDRFNLDGKAFTRDEYPSVYAERPDWYPKDKVAKYKVVYQEGIFDFHISINFYESLESFHEINRYNCKALYLIKESKKME